MFLCWIHEDLELRAVGFVVVVGYGFRVVDRGCGGGWRWLAVGFVVAISSDRVYGGGRNWA